MLRRHSVFIPALAPPDASCFYHHTPASLPTLLPSLQAMLEKASTTALPTEVVMRISLGQINKGHVAAAAATMSAITE